MVAATARLEAFLALSSALTGYTPFRLKGTGQAEPYLSTLTEIVGETTVDELLEAYRGVAEAAGTSETARDRGLRLRILSDEKLGPVTRRLIKLWFVGTWYELEPEWREKFGATDKDTTFVVSPVSYTEGLLWPTIGANPSGAKPLGYGIWATPPQIPRV